MSTAAGGHVGGADQVKGENVPGEERGGLKRVIGPGMLTVFVLGDILGAGIYSVLGEVAGAVGGAIWASFAIALVLAALTACSYAELVTKYPGAAGAALYVNNAFRKPFLTFLVAVAVMASGIASASSSARAFGGDYLSQFVELPTVLVAVLFITALALINYRGINESVKVNLALTAVEVTGLLIIIVIGAVVLTSGGGEPARALEVPGDSSVPLALLGGVGLSFFSFLGFEDSVNLAEETRDPTRIFPRALFLGLAAASVIYLLVAFTAPMVVDPAVLGESDAPLLEVVLAGPVPIPPQVFAIFALVAVTNTSLINLIMASRMLYGLARQGIVPAVFARVSPSRKTPPVAIVVTTLLAFALVTTGDIGNLASTTVALLLIVFGLVNISVLILRRDRVDHEHFSAPAWVAAVGAVSSIGFVIYRAVDSPENITRAALLLLFGVLLYGINRIATGRVATIDPNTLET